MIGAGIFALLGQAGAIAGGIVEYLTQCFGEGLFSGAMSIVLYIAGIVSISLVARTFGSYAASLLPSTMATVAVPILSSGIVILLMWINLEGARNMVRLENIIVASKVSVLVVLAIIATFGALIAAAVYLVGNSPKALYSVVAFITMSFVLEFFLRRIRGRIVSVRAPR